MAWFRRMWNRQFDQYSSDDNYHSEIQIPRFALSTEGIWSEVGKTNRTRFFISLAATVVLMTIPHFMRALHIRPSDKFVAIIASIMYFVCLIGSTLSLHCNSKLCRSILDEMQKNWGIDHSEENRKVMHYYAGYSRKLSFIVFACNSLYIFHEIFTPIFIAATTEKRITMVPRGLWYPFPLDNDFVLATCYIFTLIIMYQNALTIVGIDISIATFLLHTCGQLTILGNRMRAYEGQIRHSSRQDLLENCSCLKCIVNSHLKICEFVKKINRYFRMAIFLRLAWSVVFFCAVGLAFAKTFKARSYQGLARNVSLSLVVPGPLLVWCWLAEMCQKKSHALGDIAYSTDWSTRHPNISRNLMFIIRHTRIVLKITAGRFHVLSLGLFKEFIFTSWSYLSVLMTIELYK